jgi:hypothetical protein
LWLGRGLEAYQRVAHGLGDRVGRGAVERHTADDVRMMTPRAMN